MTEFLNSQTGWLNLTNVLLGVAVFLCFVAIGRAVLQEVHIWAVKRFRTAPPHDDHAFTLESLGITMADGGKPLNEMTQKKNREVADRDDPQNIIRSDN